VRGGERGLNVSGVYVTPGKVSGRVGDALPLSRVLFRPGSCLSAFSLFPTEAVKGVVVGATYSYCDGDDAHKGREGDLDHLHL